MRLIRLSCVLIFLPLLQACTDVAMSGVQMVYNRQDIQKKLTDQYITLQANQALNYKTNSFKNANIAVSTFNREVLLAGQVPEAWQKNKAERYIKAIPQVDHVYNLLIVSNPSSTLTRVSDAWLTAKVKAKLLASNDLDATKVKVITENGTVYLMGILLPEEAQAATEIASNTGGVENVVKVFLYMHISKTEREIQT